MTASGWRWGSRELPHGRSLRPSLGAPSYLLGLVGAGIGASLTPAMQEREGRRAGLRLSYRLLDADRSRAGRRETCRSC